MPQPITTSAELESVVGEALGHERYAIDTEFHRERTYFPQVALVQLAYGGTTVLIDPLSVDLHPLARLLDGDGCCVMHAGTQDLEVLELACDTVPSRLFDTQVAAGFLGVSTGSLSALLKRFLDIDLPKGDRLTDWLRRPLTDDQLRYAASDVDHLLPLADELASRLNKLGRLSWAETESELLRDRPRGRRAPEDAIQRIKEARSMKGSAFRVAASVAAWREREAAERDVPVRQVLSDLGVVAVAQRAPKNTKDLRSLRGVEGRHLKDGADVEIIAAVEEGRAAPKEAFVKPQNNQLPKELRPVVTLVTSWVSQVGRDNQIDPALLATRADVEALLRGDEESRLLSGWRQRLVGGPIAHLVSGRAAVAFDGDGKLVLEQRSGLALDEETANLERN